MLPAAGSGRTAAMPMADGVAMAVRDVNTDSGVLGQPVTLVPGDEGEGPEAAVVTATRLVTQDRVDALVGPSTSRTALALLDGLVREQVPVCSPAATASALTDVADHGLFVRTIGSDRLEATAVADVIAGMGRHRVGVLAPADDYGRGMADAMTAALDRAGTSATTDIPYAPNGSDVNAVVNQTMALGPDAIALVGLPDVGSRLLAALQAAGTSMGSGPSDVLVVVTDGLRVTDLPQRVSPGHPEATAGLWAVGPATQPPAGDAWFTGALAAFAPGVAADYAGYAYDCTILLALAAEAAGTDDPVAVASQLVPVSRDGQRCTSYGDCRQLLDQGVDIDYDGVTGASDLTDRGDADRGVYDVQTFNADGSTTILDRTLVRLA